MFGLELKRSASGEEGEKSREIVERNNTVYIKPSNRSREMKKLQISFLPLRRNAFAEEEAFSRKREVMGSPN